MPITRLRARALAAIVGLPLLAAGLVSADSAFAHAGGSFCHGSFVNADGHGEGACEAPFQGFPVGVIGTYDAGDPTAQAVIHVEIWARLADGTERPLGAECEKTGRGSVRCESDRNPLPTALTLFEPLPSEIVGIACKAHSHAKVLAGTEPVATFACWSTVEARAALAEDGF